MKGGLRRKDHKTPQPGPVVLPTDGPHCLPSSWSFLKERGESEARALLASARVTHLHSLNFTKEKNLKL